MKPDDIKDGEIKGFTHFIAEEFGLDRDELWAKLCVRFPQLKNRERCSNCGSSMKIDEYSPDILDALLLLKMGEAVKKQVADGIPFTGANVVHVPTLPTTDGIRHRTTRLSYLNYIKQPEGFANTGNWVITNWGWKALRGEHVPKTARLFRGELIGRGSELVTLSQMFRVHVDKVRQAIARRKKPRSDYIAEVEHYSPSEWVGFGGYSEGQLL